MHPGVSSESSARLSGSRRRLGVPCTSGQGLEYRRTRCGGNGVPVSGWIVCLSRSDTRKRKQGVLVMREDDRLGHYTRQRRPSIAASKGVVGWSRSRLGGGHTPKAD